jgi:hypothetical protein
VATRARPTDDIYIYRYRHTNTGRVTGIYIYIYIQIPGKWRRVLVRQILVQSRYFCGLVSSIGARFSQQLRGLVSRGMRYSKGHVCRDISAFCVSICTFIPVKQVNWVPASPGRKTRIAPSGQLKQMCSVRRPKAPSASVCVLLYE